MAATKIEWTATIRPDGTTAPGYSFNPWRGCTKVSQGCKHCYAEALSKRNPTVLGVWGPNGTRAPAAESYWREPLKWDREAREAGGRRRVFCASLADVFEGPETCQNLDAYSVVQAGRARLWSLIAQTPNLDWLLLTKRPENILTMLYPGEDPYSIMPRPNVWVGTSVEDQQRADERIPHLLRVPAKVRFLSVEPLLGPVDLIAPICNAAFALADAHADTEHQGERVHALFGGGASNPLRVPVRCDSCNWSVAATVDWVIVGGESGPGARPMHPDWARAIRDQCVAAGVPFFYKQWGEFAPCYDSEGCMTGNVYRVGKKAAGRKLDGRTWDEMPETGR